VKLVVTRKQLYFANGHRPETEQRVALGANRDGRLVALIHEGISQTSTVSDYAERFVRPTRAIYAAENMRGVNPVVTLNLPSPTYMRAPGENPGMFAIESAMDELAYALSIDPVQLRLINHADARSARRKGVVEQVAEGVLRAGRGTFRLVEANSRAALDARRSKSRRLGHGQCDLSLASLAASARAVMKADGTVVVSSGSHEMGMGTATVMAQLAAETLGLPVERVRFEVRRYQRYRPHRSPPVR